MGSRQRGWGVALAFVLCLIGAVSPFLPTRAGGSAPGELAGWWKAEGDAGDATGRSPGTLSGGTSFAPGIAGQGFLFDGFDDRVLLGDPEELKITGSLTLSAWIRVSSLPVPAPRLGQILFRGDDRGALDPYYLAVVSSGMVRFHVESQTEALDLEAPISVGVPVHVAATLDDATGAVRLTLNGALAAEATTTIRPFRDLESGFLPGVSIGNLQGNLIPAVLDQPFHGVIDEVQVYARALHPVEVEALFQAGSASRHGLAAAIDVRPGRFPNGIRRRGLRRVPVALFSQPGFDAPTQLAPTSLRIGPTGTETRLTRPQTEDANGDGTQDLVASFVPKKARFRTGDTLAVVRGEMTDGTVVVGTDAVEVRR